MIDQPVEVVSTRPASPILWTSVVFLLTSHRKLTSDPVFTDNRVNRLVAETKLQIKEDKEVDRVSGTIKAGYKIHYTIAMYGLARNSK